MMEKDNIFILDRIRGVRAQAGTPDTDDDPRNPNFVVPKDGLQCLKETLEDMGFSDPHYVAEAISERLFRHGYAVAAKEKIHG